MNLLACFRAQGTLTANLLRHPRSCLSVGSVEPLEDRITPAFGAVFELSSLIGINGFQTNGEAAGDSSGFSVSAAGDVNGDGFDDLIIGAYGAGPNGIGSGASYVVFGKAGGFAADLNLSTLDGSSGFQINGEAADDESGFSVSAAGDVNGDGFGDLIIGAPRADPNGSSSGASYVVFGKAGGFAADLNLSTLDGSNGFQINGEAVDDFSGRSVSAAGDVNGDGLGDLIIGAPRADPNGISSGASYVVFGKAGGFAADLNLSTLDGSNGFQINGERANDQSGISVSAAGDVNGDGFGDLIIGAYRAYANGIGSGASYVVFGKAGGFAADLNLSTLDGSNGFKINGEADSDSSGISVSGVGDVNGDGFGDLIIGAYSADPNGGRSGASYVVFGKAGGFAADLNLSTLDGSNGFQINGEAAGDFSGHSVSGVGDVNGDGFGDLIIGAYSAVPNGASYVVFGKAGGFAADLNLSTLDGSNGFQINGEADGDFSGRSVSAAGDVNGDGLGDLIIGANLADANGSSSGASYVVFGQITALTVTTTADTVDPIDEAMSLREAILMANSTPGLDTIKFNIPGTGVHTISPASALPTVTDPVVIDGYSQPGANANTLAIGSNATLLIELDGSLTPNTNSDNGLRIDAGSSTVRGLIINRFSAYGIAMINGDDNTIAGNWIGPNADGLSAVADSTFGVLVTDSSNNLIGGSAPADRNVIAGNEEAFEITGNTGPTASTNNRILGNYFGVGKDGTTPLGNSVGGYTQGPGTIIGGPNPGEGNVIANTIQGSGVLVDTQGATGSVIQGNLIGLNAAGAAAGNAEFGIAANAPNLIIGGNTIGARNVISSNGAGGVVSSGNNVVIRGNFIGTDVTGTLARPNMGHGIEISDIRGIVITTATIGGAGMGEGNLIAFNSLDGVFVEATAGTSGVAIRGNSIHSNGLLGINLRGGVGENAAGVTANDTGDADSGANNLQNFPVLTSAVSSFGSTIISGTFNSTPNSSFTLDFYASSAADPSGFGEGQVYLGFAVVSTDANGNVAGSFFSAAQVAGGTQVTATATDSSGNTSEFSAAFLVPATGTSFTWDAGGGMDANWFNPLNWVPDGVPGATDTAILNVNSTIDLTAATSVGAFNQSAGTFTGAGAFTILGDLTWTGGTMGGTGTTSVAGAASTISGIAQKGLDRTAKQQRGR